VFCEKPFLLSVEEADDVIALARAQRRLVAVNNQYRYMPIYRQTRERLAAGEFGRLYAVQCWQQMFHPPANEKVSWRRGLKRATLFEFGTHALDLICYLFDGLPESLAAYMPRVRPEYESDVLVQMSLRFPEERLATVFLNRVSHAPERYLEMRLDCEKASLRLSLGGVARASVEWSSRLGRPAARLSFVRGGAARSESGGRSQAYVKESQPAFMSATAAHLERFVAEIRKDPLDYRPVEHAREILRLALAGYESSDSGDVVRFSR
jgi:predicted dehydrogenase